MHYNFSKVRIRPSVASFGAPSISKLNDFFSGTYLSGLRVYQELPSARLSLGARFFGKSEELGEVHGGVEELARE